MRARRWCSRCPRLVLSAALASLAGLAFVGVLAGCGNAGPGNAPNRFENHRTGLELMIPHGWRAWDSSPYGSRALMLSTYPIARLGDTTETPPKGETWLLLYDSGPLWNSPGPGWAKQFQPLPRQLPPEGGIEGFGNGRNLFFRVGGHAFQAFIKGDPGPTATLGLLRSIRFTPYGRSLALAVKVHTVEGVQIWRIGNPRSTRRLIVVGCPRRAKGCSGLAVTNSLVNRPDEPLAADLWVIESLHGRDDILARLQRQLRPEATIRLGSIRDPELWARRIVALAR